MSKTINAQQQPAPATESKKAKKPVFALAQEELKMVTGGGGVITGRPGPGGP